MYNPRLSCTFLHIICIFFFFNDTATTEIYTLSLHDALPILAEFGFTDQRDLDLIREDVRFTLPPELATIAPAPRQFRRRSEEHTSELQSRLHLVCRLLLEKKKRIEQCMQLPIRNYTHFVVVN